MVLFTLDIFLLSFMPQYATYSSQRYVTCSEPPLPTPLPDSTAAQLTAPEDDYCDQVLKMCDWTAATPQGQCVMTRLAVMWARTAYKTWYFSVIIYWLTWIFLVILILESCWIVSRYPTSFLASNYRVNNCE